MCVCVCVHIWICFRQTGEIPKLNGSSLLLVEKFTSLGSSISSTETDIGTRLSKAWTAIDRLSVIWKLDLTDKKNHSFFQVAYIYIYIYRERERGYPWCNDYRRRKWTRWHEFKSWTRLIAFHIALIPLGNVWIQLFSLQLWVNSRRD